MIEQTVWHWVTSLKSRFSPFTHGIVKSSFFFCAGLVLRVAEENSLRRGLEQPALNIHRRQHGRIGINRGTGHSHVQNDGTMPWAWHGCKDSAACGQIL